MKCVSLSKSVHEAELKKPTPHAGCILVTVGPRLLFQIKYHRDSHDSFSPILILVSACPENLRMAVW